MPGSNEESSLAPAAGNIDHSPGTEQLANDIRRPCLCSGMKCQEPYILAAGSRINFGSDVTSCDRNRLPRRNAAMRAARMLRTGFGCSARTTERASRLHSRPGIWVGTSGQQQPERGKLRVLCSEIQRWDPVIVLRSACLLNQ